MYNINRKAEQLWLMLTMTIFTAHRLLTSVFTNILGIARLSVSLSPYIILLNKGQSFNETWFYGKKKTKVVPCSRKR